MQVMSCVLLFGALYEESRYMKSVVAISLARYRNLRCKNSRGNLLYLKNSSRYD